VSRTLSVVASESLHVLVTREGPRWLADIPALPSAHTWARTLPGLEQAVRDAIIVTQGLPDEAAETLRFSFEFHLDRPVSTVSTR